MAPSCFICDNISEPMQFRNTEAQEVAKIGSDERYLTTLLRWWDWAAFFLTSFFCRFEKSFKPVLVSHNSYLVGLNIIGILKPSRVTVKLHFKTELSKTEALRLKRVFKVSKYPGHVAWRLHLECGTNKNMISINEYLESDNPSILSRTCPNRFVDREYDVHRRWFAFDAPTTITKFEMKFTSAA